MSPMEPFLASGPCVENRLRLGRILFTLKKVLYRTAFVGYPYTSFMGANNVLHNVYVVKHKCG